MPLKKFVNCVKKIYTKTGDNGETSLRNGARVPKDDPRIETNGQIDHLNSLLGVVRAYAAEYDLLDFDELSLLYEVQRELMVIMSHIATPDGEENPRQLHSEQLTHRLEESIDRLSQGRNLSFVIPGDNLRSAYIHTARTQTRTCERRLWALHRTHPVQTEILTLMNRLSDYLFALAISTSHPVNP